MSSVTLDAVLRRLRTLVPGKADQRSDAELLQCFVHQHDESAFTALLQRHGPMVLNVCRCGVRHPQDAEDAFQATFLVLAAKARSIRQPGSVASWLHGVAQRIAAQARVESSRWQACPIEESVVSSVDDLSEVTLSELRAVVDDELSQLPEKYRAPLVLCYLQWVPTEPQEQASETPRAPIMPIDDDLAVVFSRDGAGQMSAVIMGASRS
ncbi:MAG: sigma-70 family RNA polymerase sigma factor [Gemmataceae bacterium]|nr:sigma-70 family RNA polymerase sigma factor [Gemmataceae bacterium]